MMRKILSVDQSPNLIHSNSFIGRTFSKNFSFYINVLIMGNTACQYQRIKTLAFVWILYFYSYETLSTLKTNKKVAVSTSWLWLTVRLELCCQDWLSPGPGCSKLTTSLVNVSLKFQM